MNPFKALSACCQHEDHLASFHLSAFGLLVVAVSLADFSLEQFLVCKLACFFEPEAGYGIYSYGVLGSMSAPSLVQSPLRIVEGPLTERPCSSSNGVDLELAWGTPLYVNNNGAT